MGTDGVEVTEWFGWHVAGVLLPASFATEPARLLVEGFLATATKATVDPFL